MQLDLVTEQQAVLLVALAGDLDPGLAQRSLHLMHGARRDVREVDFVLHGLHVAEEHLHLLDGRHDFFSVGDQRGEHVAFGTTRRFEAHLGTQQDTAQWLVDLVGDGRGIEAGFEFLFQRQPHGLRGPLLPLPCRGQFGLDHPAFADVEKGDVENFRRRVPDGSAPTGQNDMDDAAILVDEPLLEGVAVDLASQHSFELVIVRCQVVGVGQISPGLLEKLLPRVAQDAAGFVVDVHPPLCS